MYIYKSVSPMTNKLFKTFDCISTSQLLKNVDYSYNCFMYNQGLGHKGISKKQKKLKELSGLLYSNKD